MIVVFITGLLYLSENTTAEKNPEWSYQAEKMIFNVKISDNGRYIVAGSQDNNVYLFKNNDSNPLWNFTTQDSVTTVAISNDGKYIVAGSEDYNVYFFDRNNSIPLWNFTSNNYVRSVDISANGEYIVASSFDYNVYLFHKDSSTPIWSFATNNHVLSVSISADGQYIAVGSRDDEVYIFHKDNNTPLWNYTAGDDVYSIDISSDGNYIVAGSWDDNIYLFRRDNSTPLWYYTVTGSDVNVWSVAISDNCEYIVAGSSTAFPYENGKIYLFEKSSSSPLWIAETHKRAFSVAISSIGSMIVVGTDNNYILNYEKSSNMPIWSYITNDRVYSVDISSKGNYLVAGSTHEDNKVYLFSDIFQPSAMIQSISSVNVTSKNPSYNISKEGSKYIVEVSSAPIPVSVNNVTFTLFDVQGNSIMAGSVGDIYGYFPGNGKGIIFADNDFNGKLSSTDQFSIIAGEKGSPLMNHKSVNGYVFRLRYEGVLQGVTVLELKNGGISGDYLTQVIQGETVDFVGTVLDSDGDIVTYEWCSNIDGILSDRINFSSSSLSVGFHSIRFRVQDNNTLWSNNITTTLRVYAVPTAIAGEDITIKPGSTVQFNGQGSDEDGDIALYEWDFDGNGIYDWSSEDNGITTFIYNNEGTYTAVLRVTDDDDFTSTDEVTIIVKKDDDDDDSPGFEMSGLLILSILPLLRRQKKKPECKQMSDYLKQTQSEINKLKRLRSSL